jgi:hypothetical protein
MDELLTSGADDARMDGVLDHIESCAECAAQFELLNRLRTEDLVEEPEDAAFLAMRRDVIRGIRNGEPGGDSLFDRIRALFV